MHCHNRLRLAGLAVLVTVSPLAAQTQLVDPEGVRLDNEAAAAAALRRLEYRRDPVAILSKSGGP